MIQIDSVADVWAQSGVGEVSNQFKAYWIIRPTEKSKNYF